MTRLVSQGRILRPTYDETVGGVRKVRKHSILPGQFIPSLNFRHQIDDDAIAGIGTLTPTAATRASAAFKRVDTAGVTLLTSVGSSVVRLGRIEDLNGLGKVCEQIEPAETNSCIQNQTLNNAAWTKRGTGASADATADITDPTGNNTANKITGIATGTNDIFMPSSLSGGTPEDKAAVSFWIYPSTAAGVIAIYNPHQTARGTWTLDLAGLTAGKWHRIDRASPLITVVEEFQYSDTGDVGIHFAYSSGTGPFTFYHWNSQVIDNGGYLAGSDIGPTVAAAVTRAADVYYHKLDDGALVDGKGAVAFDLLIPNHTPDAAINVLEISDGGAAGDGILFQIQTDGTIDVIMDADGGDTRTATVAGDNADGAWHSFHCQWQAGQFIVRRDGVAGTSISATVAADIPDNLDRLTRVKANIANIQVWNQPYWPGV